LASIFDKSPLTHCGFRTEEHKSEKYSTSSLFISTT